VILTYFPSSLSLAGSLLSLLTDGKAKNQQIIIIVVVAVVVATHPSLASVVFCLNVE